MANINNLLEYLEKTAPQVPGKVAYANEETELTFGEVYRRARGTGTALAAAGYYREPVVVYMHKHPDMINAFFGVVYAGCFYVPIDEEMPAHRIGLIFATLKPRVVICDETTEGHAKDLDFGGRILLYRDICETEEDSGLSNWSKLRIINECTLALLDLGVKTSATRLKIQN